MARPKRTQPPTGPVLAGNMRQERDASLGGCWRDEEPWPAADRRGVDDGD